MIRGRDIGLVPQDPMSNLNPVAKIGTQVAETLLAHGLANRQNVQQKVVEALTARVRTSKPAPGVARLLAPGDPSPAARRQSSGSVTLTNAPVAPLVVAPA